MKNKELDSGIEPVERNDEESVNESVEESIERPYKLRKLKDSDLFPLLQIFRKCGLKDFKDTLSQVANGKTLKEVGAMVVFDMVDIIIDNICGAAGKEIYSFWSELSGIAVEDIKEMEFGTLPMMICDSFTEVKNTAFFKVLSKLL